MIYLLKDSSESFFFFLIITLSTIRPVTFHAQLIQTATRFPDASLMRRWPFIPVIENLPLVPINSYVTVSQEKVNFFPLMHKIVLPNLPSLHRSL